jgi:multiple sugar transport system substrate-binding protein
MREIEFSIFDVTYQHLLRPLIDKFQTQFYTQVQLRTIPWGAAWPTLLEFALQGKGPAVSVIGSTWSSSLIAMEALRPFSRVEITGLGGTDSFFPPVWQSTMLMNDPQIWSVPLSAYAFVLLYRRDLLDRASLDEHTAFANADAIIATLDRLQQVGIRRPWIIPTVVPYVDRVHICASWIWGAGGDIVDSSGRKILANWPEALAGLERFFSLYRFLYHPVDNLDYEDALSLFAQGEAAVAIAGVDDTAGLLRARQSPEVCSNLGVAPLPGVPWIGGENMVIWKHAQGYLDQERSALQLVKYLSSKEVQVRYNQPTLMPVRSDAMAEIPVENELLKAAIRHTFQNGRPHRTMRLWSRIERQLGQTLDEISAELLADPAAKVGDILQKHLDPLAKRLTLLLN